MAAQVALRRQNASGDSVVLSTKGNEIEKQTHNTKHTHSSLINNKRAALSKTKPTTDFVEQQKLFNKNIKKLREQNNFKNLNKKSKINLKVFLFENFNFTFY